MRDFILYMWTPWLVYDDYPRRSTISIRYIIKKCITTFVVLLMIYIIHTDYILPEIESSSSYSYVQFIFKCMLPMTLTLFLMFYVIFECICNIFAEITKLDHRYFYQDFWNSTTYE